MASCVIKEGSIKNLNGSIFSYLPVFRFLASNFETT